VRVALRDLLPERRRSVTFNMTFGGQNTQFAITVGFYADDRVGEIFIDGAKVGSEMSSITHDSAVLTSMALQYGVPLNTMRHALSRNPNGEPLTVLGAVLDRIAKEYL
jgi:hypothetical protein